MTHPTVTPAMGVPATAPTGTLDKRLVDFLLDFGVAVQKHAIYPPGHPQLTAAVERVMKRLDAAMVNNRPISLGIARTQVVVEGVATDPNNALMKELAQRFHRHRLGSITIHPEVLRDELADFLVASSKEEHEGPQIALAAQTERWPHIGLTTVVYDKLELMGEDSGLTEDEAKKAGAKLIWIALARATLLLGQGELGDDLLDPMLLANALNKEKDDPAYDQTVVNALMEITEALKGAQGEEAAETAGRMADLLRSLQPETLERLMEMGGDVDKRRKFVLDSSQTLAAEAVLVLVQAAAKASKQTISHTMLRLIGKLALQAEKGGSVMRAGASRALKDQVEALADDWDPRRLNPESYQDALDRMAQRRVFTLMQQRQHPCEPKRLVATALETDTLGAPVWLAVNQLISHGGIAMLLDLLDRAPQGNKVAEELWPLVATPENIRHLLREEQIDPKLLERITSRMGLDVVDLLLEGLETSETRTMRRKLLDLLAKFGSDVGPMVVKRLADEDQPWYVQRNLLTLLQMLPAIPADFQAQRYMTHGDERVRREALKLLLRTPATRTQTLIAALGDRDDGIVKLAMQAALDDCPKAAVPLVVRHVERKSIQPELRALGLRIVGAAKDPATLPWLLTFAVTRTRFLRREKLLPKSPEMLAALTGLATGWGEDVGVQAILDKAQKSKDLEIRAAATARRKPSDRTNSIP
ncbi:MAG TPA: hypothetical protein VMT93_10255 [Gemmatimonadaceae bacterium]|nr:hypothetical protein [Gemmatimonadaceae bacterium]